MFQFFSDSNNFNPNNWFWTQQDILKRYGLWTQENIQHCKFANGKLMIYLLFICNFFHHYLILISLPLLHASSSSTIFLAQDIHAQFMKMHAITLPPYLDVERGPLNTMWQESRSLHPLVWLFIWAPLGIWWSYW